MHFPGASTSVFEDVSFPSPIVTCSNRWDLVIRTTLQLVQPFFECPLLAMLWVRVLVMESLSSARAGFMDR